MQPSKQNAGTQETNPKFIQVLALSGYRRRDSYWLKSISRPHDLRSEKRALLFVHGADYSCPREVLNDLVKPYLSQSGLSTQELFARYEVFFLSWNSNFICHKRYNRIQAARLRFLAFTELFSGMPRWRELVQDVEQRALESSRFLQPYLIHMAESFGPRFEVVSHSLGSFLMSDLIQRLAEHGLAPKHMGSWLSLQPAVETEAYSSKGKFHLVPQVFSKGTSPKEIWYSKWDCALTLFHLFIKNTKSLGHNASKLPTHWTVKDLTWKVREAHGSVCFTPFISDFFGRVSNLLKVRFQDKQPTMPA